MQQNLLVIIRTRSSRTLFTRFDFLKMYFKDSQTPCNLPYRSDELLQDLLCWKHVASDQRTARNTVKDKINLIFKSSKQSPVEICFSPLALPISHRSRFIFIPSSCSVEGVTGWGRWRALHLGTCWYLLSEL